MCACRTARRRVDVEAHVGLSVPPAGLSMVRRVEVDAVVWVSLWVLRRAKWPLRRVASVLRLRFGLACSSHDLVWRVHPPRRHDRLDNMLKLRHLTLGFTAGAGVESNCVPSGESALCSGCSFHLAVLQIRLLIPSGGVADSILRGW